MKRLDVILILIFGVGVLAQFSGFFEAEDSWRRTSEDQVRRPPPVGDPLPPPSSNEQHQVVISDGGPPRDSLGTAFSLDSDGLWMTARHVVEGCDVVAIVTGPSNAIRVDRIWEDPVADLALFSQSVSSPALLLSDRLPVLGEEAFGIGFPQGEPREVSGQLIGRGQSITRGRSVHEPILVWAEQRRFPEFEGSLGGISGGPVLSYSGDVLGVLLSSSRRRGRFNTSSPEALLTALDAGASNEDLQGERFELGEDLADQNIRMLADRMRSEGTVSLVYCDVYEGDGGGRRRKG